LLLAGATIASATNPIWIELETGGQPMAAYNLGDTMGEYYINMEIGQESWNQSDIGIGQSTTGSGENWATASHYEDRTYPNKAVRRNLSGFQFTATGSWYVYGRAREGGGDAWTYATILNFWTNGTTFAEAGITEYFTVNALSDPSGESAAAGSTAYSEIDLSWTDWSGKNVMIVRRKGAAVAWSPAQGTTYSDGQDLGSDTVVVKGTYGPTDTLTDTGLDSDTTYHYKIYSENYSYYSDGVTVSATTDYRLANAWHIPTNEEPAGDRMRWPLDTPEDSEDLYIRNGSQYTGGDDANQTGGTVYHRKVGAGSWDSGALSFQKAEGNNKYWVMTVSGGTYSPGDDIEYYLELTYDNRDTTYIGTTDGGSSSTAYGLEASAQANPFETFYAPDVSSAIWYEDFQSYAEGSGIDGTGNLGDYPGSVSKWSVADGGLVNADDYFKTVSVSGDLRFEAQDVKDPITWTSESIDISLYTDVEFTVDAYEDGDHEDSDFLNVEYNTGSGWTLIQDWQGLGSATETWEAGESGSGDAGSSSVSVTQTVSGSSLQLRITVDNNDHSTAQISFDNVIVTGTLAAPATPTGIKVTDTNATDFTVEWDEMASATNYVIDVSTKSTFQTPTGNGVRINEVHADAGSDNEFIELIAPAGTDLTGYKITHYNGSETQDSDIFSHTIGSFTVLDDGETDENGTALGYYVVKKSAGTVANSDADWGSSSLQGGPDGLILYNASDAILDAVAWDTGGGDMKTDDPGTVTTSGDTAADNYLAVIGDDGTTTSRQAPDAVRSDDGTGWTLATATPGAINDGQTSGSIVLQAANPSYVAGYSNTLTGTDEEITVSGLTHSTTYYYRLRSMGTGGTSANSATKSVTTEAPAAGGANATLDRTGGETANIAYATYQANNILGNANAASVLDLQIADGVSDSYSTEMTDVSFTVTGHANLRRAALYDGATEIAEVAVSGSPITFSGMSGANVTAADTGTKDLTLYVTFQSSVTDNEQLSFTVSSVSATGGGTTFAAADGGGAASLTSGDNNRIEVTATKLVLSGIPASVEISENFSATVMAKDALDNTDLDSTTSVAITQSGNNGTLTGGGATALTAGTHTFSTLQVDGSGSFTITASDGSLTDDTSGTITISELNTGDIRFIGFNCDGNDDFSIVTFEDIQPSTEIYFRAANWETNAFDSGDAGDIVTWNSGGTLIDAGTVINFTNVGSNVEGVSRGSAVGDLDFGTADGIFCYLGSDANTPTRFLSAVGNASVGASFGTLEGTGLTDDDTAMRFSGDDIGVYTNARSGYSKATYKTMVADASNWQVEDAVDAHDNATSPDLPFDITPFTFASLPSLSEGDLAFIAFDADVSDGFAVVALAEIPANANIYFTDNAWTNSPAGLLDSEGALTWATGGSAIPAGTVIRFELGGMTADYGTVSETDAGFDIGVANDGILAFIGNSDDDPTTFLAAVGNGTSAQNCFGTLDGTGLTLGDTALLFGSDWDVAEYVATRNGEDAFADYRALITDTSNWMSQDDTGDQSGDGTRPDVPFNDRAFRLGAGPTLFMFK